MVSLRLRRPLARSMQLERLEGRSCMAASVVATLTSTGVLQVEGTDGADQIGLSLVGDRVRVRGVVGSFAAARVQSITINTLDGNDRVNLSGLGFAWSKPINVYNPAGTDQVTSVDGSYLRFAAGVFRRDASGAQSFAPVSTGDWFDSNIKDTALKALLKTDFADQKLDRDEMLAVFRQVEKDAVVIVTEFNDLTAVANNSSLFTTVEYVGVLTKDVVLGNAANAQYLGAALGNLQANDSYIKLDNLVNKWFLGADHPLATYGNTTLAYANAKGMLFGAGGPQYTDVRQGAVGDCYFVATLGETVLQSAGSVTSMFIANGDGTFTVRFYNNGQADYVTVDSQLPVDPYGRFIFANMGAYASNTANVLWVALAEKAYAEINEAGWLRLGLPGNGINSYQAIAGGYFSAAATQIANRASTTAMVSSTATFEQFTTAFAAGKMIGLASNSAPGSSLIVGGHQYVAVGYDATAKTVTLYNPWGVNNGSQYPGLVTLKWTDLATSFSYWDRA